MDLLLRVVLLRVFLLEALLLPAVVLRVLREALLLPPLLLFLRDVRRLVLAAPVAEVKVGAVQVPRKQVPIVVVPGMVQLAKLETLRDGRQVPKLLHRGCVRQGLAGWAAQGKPPILIWHVLVQQAPAVPKTALLVPKSHSSREVPKSRTLFPQRDAGLVPD